MSSEISLVTGATGFVGSHLVDYLISRGEYVRALVRKTSDVSRLKELGIELCYGDLEDVDSLKIAVDGVSYIYHLGEIKMRVKNAGVKNADATRALAQLVKSQPFFKRIVFLSSLTTSSVPASLPADEETPIDSSKLVDDYYSRYKRACERVLKESQVATSVVRAGAIYGPRAIYLEKFFLFCKKTKIPLPFFGRLDIKLATIHVHDLVEILYAAAHYEGELFRVFNAIDDSNGTAKDFLDMLTKELGIHLRFWTIPYTLQLIGAKLLDPVVALRLPGKNFTGIILFMGFNHNFSNRRVKEELGVKLKHPNWDTGIQDTVAWLRSQLFME